MNQKVLKTLEFYKIIDRLVEEADSSLGKEKLKALEPPSSFLEVEQSLSETEAAQDRIRLGGGISFRGIKEIRPYFSRLALSTALSIPELYDIILILEKTKKAKEQGEEREDALQEYFQALAPLDEIRRELQRWILSEEELADDASPELSHLRRKEKGLEEKINQELNHHNLRHKSS